MMPSTTQETLHKWWVAFAAARALEQPLRVFEKYKGQLVQQDQMIELAGAALQLLAKQPV